MKVILDTNVIVSAIIQRGYPHLILDHIFLNSRIELCISEELFLEYNKVLGREKFNRFPGFYARAQMLLADIRQYALWFSTGGKIEIIPDDADNRLLELAVACNVDYLVTGNSNDFTMSQYQNTKILSPKDFFEVLAVERY